MPVGLHCNRCRMEVEPQDRFCQECGLALSGPGLSSPLLIPAQPGGTTLRTRLSGLQLPVIPEPVSDLALLAAVLCFAGALCTWMVTSRHKQEAAHLAVLAGVASREFHGGNLQLALKHLEELRLRRQLTRDEKEMLAESHLRLGLEAERLGSLSLARKLLRNIPPESRHYLRARQIIISSMLQRPAKPSSAKSPKRRDALGAPPRLSDAKVLTLPVVSDSSLKEARSSKTTEEPLQADTAEGKPTSELSHQQESVAEHRRSASRSEHQSQSKTVLNPSGSGPSQREGSTMASGKARGKEQPPQAPSFSEKDVSVYNEYLARHFTAETAGEEDSAQEPPTFKDWLEQGKPVF